MIFSLKKVFFHKFISNILSSFFGAINLFFIPKIIGPENYGVFVLLNENVNKLLNLFTFNSQSAINTFIAKDKIKSHVIFASFILFILTLFLIIIISFFFNGTIISEFLFGSRIITSIVILSFVYGSLYFLADNIRLINDSLGISFLVDKYFVYYRLITSISIAFLYYFFVGDIKTIYLILSIFYIPLIVFWISSYKKNKLFILDFRTSIDDYFILFKRIFIFSHPIFTKSLFVIFIGFVDRWLLQKFYSWSDVGFYGIVFSIISIVSIITISMSTLFNRELNLANSDLDLFRSQYLFDKVISNLFFITACLSFMLSINSEYVIMLIGGPEFKPASSLLFLMSFYPTYQSYGQICTGVFFSEENTRAYRKLSIFINTLGLFLSILFMFPSKYYGFGLGSEGLVLKMVLLQFISANLLANLLLVNACNFLKIHFKKYFLLQLKVFLFFTTISIIPFLIHCENLYLEIFLKNISFFFGLTLVIFFKFNYFNIEVYSLLRYRKL